jgi:CRP/FNR family transcriptional regulator, cyclic AMP receptor protein
MNLSSLTFATITPLEFFAFCGAILAVFSAFKKAMIPLRIVTILSTLAFCTYFFLSKNWAFGLFYAALTLLNLLRLRDMIALSRQTKELTKTDFPYETLQAFMASKNFEPEAALFRKGDLSDAAYYIVSGHVTLPEMQIDLGPGNLVGEMGLFGEKQARSLTVVAKDKVVALKIPYYALQELCLQNPSLGLSLFKLIVRRHVENQNRVSNHS